MRLALFLTALIAVVGSACSSGSAGVSEYSHRESGDEILVDSGEEFRIRLESNPSTGYTWKVVTDTGQDSVKPRNHRHEPADTDTVGAAGDDVFTFEAIGGAAVLRLEYVRPFDDPVIAERVVEYVVRVDGAPWPPEVIDPPSISTASVPLEVGALLEGDALTDVTVIGFVVWDSNGARLCEVLMESFPPQCGGAAVAIANPEALTAALEEEQAIRWTNDRVRIKGTFDGTRLTLSS